MRLFPVLLLVLLGACSDPARVTLHPDMLATGDLRQVLVVTDRARDDAGHLSGRRAERAEYLEATVSVPPDRNPGEFALPGVGADPRRHFLLAANRTIPGRAAFADTVRQRLRALPAAERDITIFVHGYNTSYAAGVFRAAQLAEDFAIKGLMLHYSWPSIAHPLGYTHDRDSILFARDGLEAMLRDVFAAGARNVILVGHSMGAQLVMETLRQVEIADPGLAGRRLNGVVLISPDVDIDVFRAQAARFPVLPQPFAILVSRRDSALRLSSRVNGRVETLGLVSNIGDLADMSVTVLDVTAFTAPGRRAHFAPGSSPALIALLSRPDRLNRTFQQMQAQGEGGLPGAMITVRNATQLILSPGLLARY